MNKQKKNKKNNLLKKNLILAVLVVIIAVVPLLFLKNSKFSGSDDQAKNEISKINANYKPWFTPVWQPPSSEIESLLFSLQAAIGSGIVCYFFGYSRGKSKASRGKKV
ncbi:energy-coupling factor ABC transporter substrate-binding protein [Clostridium algoriphilum]|uniref:energy-coupling factor ABC transporter substrate-binding protein n=1 Tax=Clostridium algoriphilum TaxID=198347 RepID=UPI001CF45A85|nr:energy-coupling factor ABC transporter substrate-binding protein [Clostridium algoriphilum]MCB2294461.1 energy-coupling factor ABC transporter substrate-binding protein [Clostridium algoriphilum]